MIILFLALLFLTTPAAAQTVGSFADDPATSSMGFSRAIVAKNKLIQGWGPGNQNSVRMYDPALDTWTVIFCNEESSVARRIRKILRAIQSSA